MAWNTKSVVPMKYRNEFDGDIVAGQVSRHAEQKPCGDCHFVSWWRAHLSRCERLKSIRKCAKQAVKFQQMFYVVFAQKQNVHLPPLPFEVTCSNKASRTMARASGSCHCDVTFDQRDLESALKVGQQNDSRYRCDNPGNRANPSN